MSYPPLRWLQSRFFFPLASLTAFALFMRAVWDTKGEPWHGPRLLLNLTLAWIPYLLSLGLVHLEQRPTTSRGLWLVVFLAWIGFFPNAPYLVTDWLYLPSFAEELWFSIGLFMSFSLCGLILSIISLFLVHGVLRTRWGRLEAALLIALMFVLSGLGVFMGRFLRLNTWELVTRPGHVLNDLANRAHDPAVHVNPAAFSLGFALLLAVCYWVFLLIRHAPRSREEQRAWPERSREF